MVEELFLHHAAHSVVIISDGMLFIFEMPDPDIIAGQGQACANQCA